MLSLSLFRLGYSQRLENCPILLKNDVESFCSGCVWNTSIHLYRAESMARFLPSAARVTYQCSSSPQFCLPFGTRCFQEFTTTRLQFMSVVYPPRTSQKKSMPSTSFPHREMCRRDTVFATYIIRAMTWLPMRNCTTTTMPRVYKTRKSWPAFTFKHQAKLHNIWSILSLLVNNFDLKGNVSDLRSTIRGG